MYAAQFIRPKLNHRRHDTCTRFCFPFSFASDKSIKWFLYTICLFTRKKELSIRISTFKACIYVRSKAEFIRIYFNCGGAWSVDPTNILNAVCRVFRSFNRHKCANAVWFRERIRVVSFYLCLIFINSLLHLHIHEMRLLMLWPGFSEGETEVKYVHSEMRERNFVDVRARWQLSFMQCWIVDVTNADTLWYLLPRQRSNYWCNGLYYWINGRERHVSKFHQIIDWRWRYLKSQCLKFIKCLQCCSKLKI